MRTFLLLLVAAVLLSAPALGQSCCVDPSATSQVTRSTEGFAQMARLTADPAFRMAHREDAPFVLADPKGKPVSFATTGAESKAYYVAAKGRSERALIILHDWRGLTDEARQQADAYSEALGGRVHVLAIDLYDGKTGTTREECSALFQALAQNRTRGEAIVLGARDWLNRELSPKARIATLGWCMGGSWSFTASVALGQQAAACVIYYGQPSTDADVLNSLAAPVLMHVPELDKWITPQMGSEFKAAMDKAGKSAEVINYPNADHAFANPTGGRFVSEAAQRADAASVAFLKKNLGL